MTCLALAFPGVCVSRGLTITEGNRYVNKKKGAFELKKKSANAAAMVAHFVLMLYSVAMDALRHYLSQSGNSQVALAEALGITQPAIAKWFRAGKVPLERVADIERITGIPREALRPDVFVRYKHTLNRGGDPNGFQTGT